jgi:hypothetical protein
MGYFKKLEGEQQIKAEKKKMLTEVKLAVIVFIFVYF